VAGVAGFLLEGSRWSLVIGRWSFAGCKRMMNPRTTNRFLMGSNEWSKPLDMLRSDQIRSWRRVGLCGLLCVAVHGFALADTPASPTKPAQASTTPAAKATHHPGGHVATKRTSGQTSSQKSKSSHGKKGSKNGSKYSSKKRGQQAIDSGRARQIQTALIREHYMQGEPSGSWDSATQAAMKHYQADQGWQSKQIPDSRALIRLGLGPSHDHLLNPESAMTSVPGDPKAAVKQTTGADNLPKN